MTSTPFSDWRVGDRVRIKKHRDQHRRLGKIIGVQYSAAGPIHVGLMDDNEEFWLLPTEALTNLSLAARRAWASMPERRVGRPASGGRKKISVSIRIEPRLWEDLGVLKEEGCIQSREALINDLLRKFLTETRNHTPDESPEKGRPRVWVP